MILRANVLPIPGTFFREVVSEEFNSTTVPTGYFSVFGKVFLPGMFGVPFG